MRMKATACRRLLWILPALLLAAGCEHSGSDSTATDSGTNAVTNADTNTAAAADTHFPDGLHPDSAASGTIAALFNDHISAAPGGIGANDPNTVVCLGDSITAAGYPAILAGLSGKNVINAGTPGEESSGGAARVAGVLAAYHPAYLCILYGANDVIAHDDPGQTIANLEAIISAARANDTIPIVATLTPMSGNYAQYAADAQQLSDLIRAMASSTGTPLADLAAAF